MKNNIFKGYIASRPIRGQNVPQRIQNLVIRTYAEKNKKIFGLSATEYIMNECFMMLNALLEDMKFEALTFYSLYMLPGKKIDRLAIYNKCIAKGVEIHFAFEELAIKNENDIHLIEDILMAKDISTSLAHSTPKLDL